MVYDPGVTENMREYRKLAGVPLIENVPLFAPNVSACRYRRVAAVPDREYDPGATENIRE